MNCVFLQLHKSELQEIKEALEIKQFNLIESYKYDLSESKLKEVKKKIDRISRILKAIRLGQFVPPKNKKNDKN